MRETPEVLFLYSKHKSKKNEKEGALELLLRAYNLLNNKPILTFEFLNLNLHSLTN